MRYKITNGYLDLEPFDEESEDSEISSTSSSHSSTSSQSQQGSGRMQIYAGGIQEIDEIQAAADHGWQQGLGLEGIRVALDLRDKLAAVRQLGRRASISLTNDSESQIDQIVDVIADSDVVDHVEVESSSWNDGNWRQLQDAMIEANLGRALYAYMGMWQGNSNFPTAKAWKRRSRHWYLYYYPEKQWLPNLPKTIHYDESNYPVHQIGKWLAEDSSRDAYMHLTMFGQPMESGNFLANKRPAIANGKMQILYQLLCCEWVGISQVSFWSVRNGWWVNGQPRNQIDKAWDYRQFNHVKDPEAWEKLWYDTIEVVEAYTRDKMLYIQPSDQLLKGA